MSKTQSFILLSLLTVIFFSWLFLFHQHWQMTSLPMSEMWMPPSDVSAWRIMDFGLVYLMWAVMMAAMMLPTAIPMILVFAKICRQRNSAHPAMIVSFVLAYLLVWFIFSILLTLLQWQMHGLHFLSPMMDNQNVNLAAAIFLLAGIYQFTPLKHTFLQYCRTPMGFLLTEWRDGGSGSFYMGFKHGVVCLGCCWTQMLIMFAVGVMNLLGMALITLLVMLEKMVPVKRQLICRLVGILFIGWGIWLLQIS
jgi:predicted metal-binding membrane protein